MKHMNLMKSLFAAVLLLPSLAGAQTTDAQPTLPETITYITDKLKDLPPAVFYTDKDTKHEIYGMKVDWFNGGILCVVASRRRTAPGNAAEESNLRYQLPLASLSVDVTVIHSPPMEESFPVAYGVVISSALPAPGTTSPGTIVVQEGNADAHSDKKITLWFRSEDTAKRVAEALHHAIELSGGKKELFGN
jgi:hypothetical protein